jgi:hypothetical protein
MGYPVGSTRASDGAVGSKLISDDQGGAIGNKARWAPQTAGRRRLTPSQLISDGHGGAVGNKRSSEVIKKTEKHDFPAFCFTNNPTNSISYNIQNQ